MCEKIFSVTEIGFLEKREKELLFEDFLLCGPVLQNSVLKWPYCIHNDALHRLGNVRPEGTLEALFPCLSCRLR
jgi:hypothetical protein